MSKDSKSMGVGGDDSPHWESRYREALESLENQGREARDLEKRLRRALGQVAVAGMGGDGRLSRYLSDIRQVAKSDAELSVVTERVETMSRFLRQQADQDIRLPPADGNLEQVLRRTLSQILMVLRHRHPEDEELFTLQSRLQSGDTRELKQSAIALERALLDSFSEKEKPSGGLGRLLSMGSRKSSSGAEVTAFASLARSLQPRLNDQRIETLLQYLEAQGPSALLPVCRELVELIETALDQAQLRPGESDSDSDSAQSRSSQTRALPSPDSEQAATSDSTAAEAAEAAGAQPANNKDDSAGKKIGKSAGKMLDALKMPGELTEEVSALTKDARSAFADPNQAADWLKRATALLERYRGLVDRERDALKRFLETVLGRLSELEGFVGSERASRARTAAAGRKLDAALEKDLADIRQVVGRSQDLGSLGKAINERLNRLNSHLNRRQAVEAKADTEAEQRLVEMEQRLKKMEEEADRLRDRLKRAQDRSAIDPLTELPNRRGYEKRLQYEVERHRRHGRPLSLAVCDLDEFKVVNDQLGHQAGDEALGRVADLVRESLRTTDYAARFGGEEFVLLLPETDLEAAILVAERLRETVASQGFAHDGVDYPLTMSIGLSTFQPADPPEKVFRRADQALLQAKESGRNRVLAADPDPAETTTD